MNIQVSGYGGLLGVVLVVLKALNYIQWPWFWVLTPFWLPFAIFAAIMLFALGVAILAEFVK